MKIYARTVVIIFILVNILNLTINIKHNYFLVIMLDLLFFCLSGFFALDSDKFMQIIFGDIIDIYEQTIKIIKFYLNI